MGFSAPSLMIQGSVKSDIMNVSGMLLPGIPAFVVGRTPHHAWAFQVGASSAWDYYAEDPEDVFVDRTEIIKVKGGDDVVLEIEASAHGPIMDELAGKKMAFKLSHHGYDFNLKEGLLAMVQAQSPDEFGEAVSHLSVGQHITYVDSEGNIGYWHSGRQPVREPGDYRIPQGLLADQPVLEWDRAVVDPLYHQLNPPEGFFASWNNKPHPDKIDYAATAAYGPFNRGGVVGAYFAEHDDTPYTFEELRDVATRISATTPWAGGGNAYTVLEEAVTDAILANPTPERTAVLEMFQEWDGYYIAGGPSNWVHSPDLSDAGVMLLAIIEPMLEMTFGDELGDPLPTFLDNATRFQVFVHGLYESGLNHDYDWYSNLEDPDAPQTSEAIILAAIDQFLADRGERPWGVGARPAAIFSHPLFGDIGALLGVPPTLDMVRSTYAQIVEMGSEGPLQIEVLQVLGQSGTILGTLFAPQLDPNVLSFKQDYDDFIHRAFPLFQ
jgi:penicillin amidase